MNNHDARLRGAWARDLAAGGRAGWTRLCTRSAPPTPCKAPARPFGRTTRTSSSSPSNRPNLQFCRADLPARTGPTGSASASCPYSGIRSGRGYFAHVKVFAEPPQRIWTAEGSLENVSAEPFSESEDAIAAVVAQVDDQLAKSGASRLSVLLKLLLRRCLGFLLGQKYDRCQGTQGL